MKVAVNLRLPNGSEKDAGVRREGRGGGVCQSESGSPYLGRCPGVGGREGGRNGMRIEEAIRYFDREVEKVEEAEAYEAAKAEPNEDLLHAWCYEREALLLAIKALKKMKANQPSKAIIDAAFRTYCMTDA